jgi:hypothetical protein
MGKAEFRPWTCLQDERSLDDVYFAARLDSAKGEGLSGYASSPLDLEARWKKCSCSCEGTKSRTAVVSTITEVAVCRKD